jgi:hypothetical protein
MNNKIVVVTSPDDVNLDGVRILLVGLDSSQTKMISDVLGKLNNIPTIIVYMSNSLDNIPWLLDKKHKSDLIIFNANYDNDVIIGYMAAQKNSHYFGTLKLLSKVNNSAIYSEEQILCILEDIIKAYEIR